MGNKPISCCPTCMRRRPATGRPTTSASWAWSRPGGAFLSKVLQGGAGKDLVARLGRSFAKVRHVKPKASRAGSAEMYVLATGFRGETQ